MMSETRLQPMSFGALLPDALGIFGKMKREGV